jgi:hypothetical protein
VWVEQGDTRASLFAYYNPSDARAKEVRQSLSDHAYLLCLVQPADRPEPPFAHLLIVSVVGAVWPEESIVLLDRFWI